MGKRGNQEGSIFQRKDGRWVFQSPRLETGTHEYITGKTRKEVSEKAKKWLSDEQSGLLARDENMTL
jgi:hypothetical protein